MTFSIRDLVWFTVVVALVLGWWLDRQNSAAERTLKKKLAEQLRLVTADLIKTKSELNARKAVPNSQALTPNPPKN